LLRGEHLGMMLSAQGLGKMEAEAEVAVPQRKRKGD
jgi:hypothetical protein